MIFDIDTIRKLQEVRGDNLSKRDKLACDVLLDATKPLLDLFRVIRNIVGPESSRGMLRFVIIGLVQDNADYLEDGFKILEDTKDLMKKYELELNRVK